MLLYEGSVLASTPSLWLFLQDNWLVDPKARFACGNPRDAEAARCPMRVAAFIIIGTRVVVAVLDSQDIASALGLDVVREKVNLTDVRLPVIHD
jgi:hypothetical protein